MAFRFSASVFASLALHGFAATCAQDGSSYEYAESVSGSTRTVSFNVCPNHYFDMGKLNPNYAVSKDETYRMPSSPMLESSSTTDVSNQGGSVGVLFNGAYLYSAFAGKVALTGYSSSATALEGDTFEKCGCHSSSKTTAGYHCHIPPSCLLAQLGETNSGHSPQVGWAPDGFPIYGPRGPTGALIKLCSESSNTDTTYCLDECSGLEMELPSVDNFKYRYYTTGEDFLDGSYSSNPLEGSDPISPLSTEPYYPFTPKCYRGCCPSGATCSGTRATPPSCSSSATAGTTSSYTAAAKWPLGLPVYDGTAVSSPSPPTTTTVTAAPTTTTTTAAPTTTTTVTAAPTTTTTTAAPTTTTAAPATAATEEVTEVELTLTVDDATAISQEEITESLAEAAGTEAGQVEVTEVEFQVAVGYRFPASMTEETAKKGLVRASGQVSSRVSVKRRSRGGGRRLQATIEMDVFDANFTAGDASQIASLANKANDTSLIADAMVLEGVENFTMEVVEEPKKKIRVKSKMRPKTSGDKAPSAPSRENVREKLGKKMDKDKFSIDRYTSKGPEEKQSGDDGVNQTTATSQCMQMGQFSILALGVMTASL